MLCYILAKESKIKRLEELVSPLLEKTGYQLQTTPGVSTATAGKIISAVGNINRFKSEKQLAKFCGVAPVSVGSGGKNKELCSKGGNRELRADLYFLAVRDYFLKKLMEGKTKTQALICIMRQLIRILYSMMKNKTEWKAPEYKR